VKIAVAGTHSTGKSTFLTRLRHLLETAGYHVSTVADQAAGARDLGFPILRNQTATTTLWIMTSGIAAELVAARRTDIVLVDRPITDALAYHLAAHAWRGEPVDPAQAAFLTDLARHHAPSYQLTYRTVIDPALGVKDDGHRDIDPHYRQLVDEAITTVHNRLDIPSVPLYSYDHTTAVRQALLLARRTITLRGTPRD
jgi:GTPase SAR1 family protein